MKHILISNDDGIDSAGLNTLYSVLSQNFKLTVAAPDRERSARSHSLTIDKKPESERIKKNFYTISGTPAAGISIAFKDIMRCCVGF